MTKYPLQIQTRRGERSPDWYTIEWVKSVPFVMSERGILVHRPRFAHTHIRNGRYSHDSTTYWCGNVGRIFLPEFPEGRILCARCEAMATTKGGLPSAESIVGHHVCIGGLRPYKTCCTHEGN